MNLGLLTQLFANIGAAAMPGAGLGASRLAGLFGGLVQPGQQAGDSCIKSDGFASILASLKDGAGATGAAGGNAEIGATSPLGSIVLPQTMSPAISLKNGQSLSAALDHLAQLVGATTETGAPDLDKLATMLGVTPAQLNSFKADLEAGKIRYGTSADDRAQAGDQDAPQTDTSAIAAALTPYLMVLSAIPAAAAQVTPAAADDLAAAIAAPRGAVATAGDAAQTPDTDPANAPQADAAQANSAQDAAGKAAGTATAGEQLAAALLDATAGATQSAAEHTPAAIMERVAKAPVTVEPLARDTEAQPTPAANAMAAQTTANANAAAQRQIDKRANRNERIREADSGTGAAKTGDAGLAHKATAPQEAAAKTRTDGTPVATTVADGDKRPASTAASELALSLKGAFQTLEGEMEAGGEDGLGALGGVTGTSPLGLSTSASAIRTASAAPNWAPFGAYVAGQVAMQISRAVKDGNDNFKIRLDPPELGRVDVKLEISHDGRINAVLAADNEKTLQLLQREQGALERALQDAGLKTDSGSLNFSLNSQQNNAREGNDGNSFGGGRGRIGGDVRVDATDMPAQAVMQMALSDRALDIRV